MMFGVVTRHKRLIKAMLKVSTHNILPDGLLRFGTATDTYAIDVWILIFRVLMFAALSKALPIIKQRTRFGKGQIRPCRRNL